MPRYKKQAKYPSAEYTRRLRVRTDCRFRDTFSAAYGNVMAYLKYRQVIGKKFSKDKLYKSMFLEPHHEPGCYTDPVSEYYTVFNSHTRSRCELMRRSFQMRKFLHRLYELEPVKNKKERGFIEHLIWRVEKIESTFMTYCKRTKETYAIAEESEKLTEEFISLKRARSKRKKK